MILTMNDLGTQARFDFRAVSELMGCRIGETMRTLAESLLPRKWVVEGLIEEGDQILIAGAPKTGKSLMSSQLAIEVALGGSFLNWRVPKPLRVYYLNLEIRKGRLGDRLMLQAGIDSSNIYNCKNARKLDRQLFPNSDLRTIDVMNAEQRAKLRQQIAEWKPDLVIFDVLARMHAADEQSQEMKHVMIACRDLATDVAHIVVHHSRKQSQEGADRAQTAADIRGSSAIHGEADLTMVLSKRAGQGARYVVTFTARNVEVPDELLLDMDEHLHFRVASDAERETVFGVFSMAFETSTVVSALALNDHVRNTMLVGERRAKDYIAQAVKKGWIQRRQRPDRKYEYHVVEGSPLDHHVQYIEPEDFVRMQECNESIKSENCTQ